MAKKINDEPIMANEVSPVEGTVSEIVASNNYLNTIKQLIADGAKKISKLMIKNVNVTELDNYVRVSLTLTSKVPAYVSNDNGLTFERSESNIIFTSSFAISAALKENNDLAWLGGYVATNPKMLPMILCGSEVTILQREYEAGEEVVNPFSTRIDNIPTVYDHDIIINDIIDIKLGKTGERMASQFATAIMMKSFE